MTFVSSRIVSFSCWRERWVFSARTEIWARMSVSRPERSDAEDLSYRVSKEVRWRYVFENVVELGFEVGDFSIAIAGDILRLLHEIVNA